jgi:hypothetical protein
MPETERPGAGTLPSCSSLSIALVGSGGAGVMTAGNMLLEAAAFAGYHAILRPADPRRRSSRHDPDRMQPHRVHG